MSPEQQEERCTVTQAEMAVAFRVLSEIAKEYRIPSGAFATLTEARRLILVEANELGLDRLAIAGDSASDVDDNAPTSSAPSAP